MAQKKTNFDNQYKLFNYFQVIREKFLVWAIAKSTNGCLLKKFDTLYQKKINIKQSSITRFALLLSNLDFIFGHLEFSLQSFENCSP